MLLRCLLPDDILPLMPPSAPALVVVGGFPGTGKSRLAIRLSTSLRVPRLCSDTVGGTIRSALDGQVPGSDAFRAGHEVLFALCEEFLSCDCSVLVDTSMGWEFQWRRMDEIRRKIPSVRFLPLMLRCPREVCIERLQRRHLEDPVAHPSADRFMSQAHLPQLWRFLQDLERPEVQFIDAANDPETVHAAAMQHLAAQSVAGGL